MTKNECVEALESDLAQYVLDRKVDESMKRYLRTRVYPIASVLGAALVFFGIKLGDLKKDYDALETRAGTAATAAQVTETQLNAIRERVGQLNGSVAGALQNLKDATRDVTTTLRTQETLLASNYEQQASATLRAAEIAVETKAALMRTQSAEQAAATHVTSAQAEAKKAKDLADTANLSTETIAKARAAADEYTQGVDKQQRILGSTVIDFALLATKIPSTVTLQHPDGSAPIVFTLTPQAVSKKGFTIDVLKNGLPQDALVIDKNDFGKWRVMPMTDDLYRFMVDFVYEQRGVRNFLVMRFSGTEKLFQKAAQTASR